MHTRTIEELKELRRTERTLNADMESFYKFQNEIVAIKEMDIADEEKNGLIGDIVKAQFDLGIPMQVKRAAELRKKYGVAIGKLGTIDRALLIDYYFLGRSYEEIAEQMFYSCKEAVYRKIKKALEELDRIVQS